MLYLHMSIPSVRMMDTYTRMIRRNFPLDEHRFVYMDQLAEGDRKLLEYGNSVEITRDPKARLKQIREEMDKADIIIWHGIMFGAKRALIPLLFKKYMRKSVWVMRGIDLYNWRKSGKGIKTQLINRINYLCRKGMPNVVAIFPTDIEVYRKQFGKRAKVFSLPYPMSESAFETMEEYRGTGPRANGKLYVQVAHNAYAFNNHLEILEQIKGFKDEDIRVIIPLSYGNDWYNKVNGYVESVRSRSVGYFGSKAVILKHLMPPDEYSDLLCNVDVSIYNSARQNGLGNILRSLYIGNKVYLSRQNPLYHFFREQGIDVYETERISEQSYEEFSHPSDSAGAVDWIRRTYYPDASAVYWRSMFEYFRDGRKQETPAEEIDKQLTAVLERDFSGEVAQRRTKLNYFNLSHYAEQPKGTKLAAIRRVLILGADSIGTHIYHAMRAENKSGTKWSIDGFADYHLKMLEDPSIVCDIIGTPETAAIRPEACCFNTFPDAADRRRAAATIQERGGMLSTYLDKTSYISPSAAAESGCILLDNSTVMDKASIGCCSILKSAFVDFGAQIGAYCTLERNCWIGEGAMIGDEVMIGSHAKIAPGVRIADGTVIPAFSTVTEDIL